MVSTDCPSQFAVSERQARTATPSSITVQAPHTPWLQPRLAPVSCKRSRSEVSSVSVSGTSSATLRSLTLIVT